MKRRFWRNFLVIIEYHDGGRIKSCKNVFEVSPCECRNAHEIFRSKKGERFFESRCSLSGRETHEVEKGGDVRVAFIELIPETGELAGIQVTCGNRGLAGPGRSADPRDWVLLSAFVEETE